MLELDDLRRQWQQPTETAPPPVGAAELRGMLAGRAGGLVEKMRRNTWYEAAFVAFMAVVIPFYIWYIREQMLMVMIQGIVWVMMLLALGYYYKQLRLLRQLTFVDTQVRTHLRELCAGLRRGLQFYYWLGIGVYPFFMVVIMGYEVNRELAHPGAFRWKYILLLALVNVVIGVVLQIVMVYANRKWIQRLYGQHLDRLEASLRELDEPEAAPAR
jgi:hypothetical protein